MENFPRRSGFALAYLLFFAVLIAMCVTALLALGRQGLQTTRGGVDRTRALYAAEAGLARAIAEMERDPTWTAGFNDQTLPGGTGTYSTTFATNPADADKDKSYNNLMGATPVDTYHGPLSLPAHSAVLVVTGRSGVATRTVEALVVTGVDVPVTDALTATGPIRLAGSVRVDGRKSLVDGASRLANLHHNSMESGIIGVTYHGGSEPWEQIQVTGEVTSSSPSPSNEVIVFNTSSSVPTARSAVPLKELPRPNITAMLDEHSSLPGSPVPPTPGNWALSGDNYYAGNVTVNGDLELQDGARLYVRGNLFVNGSVRGMGTLVVGGSSEFYGDAEVSGQRSEYIALLSRGSVTLKGFEGQTYMRALASGNGEAAERWEDLSFGLRRINEIMKPLSGLEADVFQEQLKAADAELDLYQAMVGHHPYGVIIATQQGLAPALTAQGRERTYSNSTYFRDLLGGGPPLSAQRFLTDRFQHLDDWFRQGQLQRDHNAATGLMGSDMLDNYEAWNPVIDGGMFDSLQSIHQQGAYPVPFTGDRPALFSDAMAAVQAFDYDRLGNANFKGLIYTSGAFVGRDDVTVLGAVIVNGDPDVPALEFDGVTYQPGQVGLFGHSRLTRVDEFFDDGVHTLVGAGSLDIKRWVSR